MEDYLEYIIPLLGYFLYWLFTTNKKLKKRKPSQGPLEAQRPPETNLPSKKSEVPEPHRVESPVLEEEEEDNEPSFFDFDDDEPEEDENEPKEETVSFEELLRRFQNPREYEEEQKKKRDPERITKRAETQLGSNLKPDSDFGKPLSREILESIKLKEPKKKKKIKPFDIKKLVSSPNSVRDALVMKEVFDRKF